MRKLILISTVLVLTLIGPTTAWAQRPSSQSFAFSESEAVPCGTFDAVLVRNISGTETLFFDRTDELVRVNVNLEMNGSVTSSTTGKRVAIRGHWVFVVNLTQETWSFNGQVFMANRPGEGHVIQDTGRLAYGFDDSLIRSAGPHDAVDTGGQIFCDAVA